MRVLHPKASERGTPDLLGGSTFGSDQVCCHTSILTIPLLSDASAAAPPTLIGRSPACAMSYPPDSLPSQSDVLLCALHCEVIHEDGDNATSQTRC